MLLPPQYCSKCVYPNVAVNLDVDDDIVCSACHTASAFIEIPEDAWTKRRAMFEQIAINAKKDNNSNYDCIVPVSGGKDSYYQTHLAIKEYGLKPLLVTYHGNNYLPEGDYNRDRMREVFDADHIVFGPSVDVLKKINRLAFRKMGDMNWHNHCGITTVPIQAAVQFKIPLIIWGEIDWDVSGMFDPDHFCEFSARVRHEHTLRGFEWYDLINDPIDTLTEKDMLWSKYPTDQEIVDNNVKGIFVGNFFRWDATTHTKQMQDLYNWKSSEQPFERTYRRTSNLDDRYENGIHDLMKFVKFGYGRASDHASKDIRDGLMTRQEGINMVKKYDHVVSSDLQYWLNYVDMSEDEFWQIADSFRDPRVWWIQNNQWWKHNIWGEASAYGDVRCSDENKTKYKVI